MAKLTVRDTPLLEWIVGAIGAILFVAALAVLVKAGLRVSDAPPDIEVRVERVVTTGQTYVVQFIARNEGDATAANVEIVGRLGDEERRAHIDYLPPRSERRGGLIFAQDPRGGAALELSADGYMDP